MAEHSAQMEQYMRRCIQLALKAQGMTSPNPMVGSVIVHNDKIIGEGFHLKAGTPHAEVNAINSVKNQELLKESTLYVNLEPCAHFGRTPPCSLLIIEKQIPRVVIGCIDTFSEVAGKGIEMMQNNGIEVITGVCEAESRHLNRRFFTFHEQKRPYIILKWAQSADGYIDALRTADKKPLWLTNSISRMYVHKQRTEEDAILIGTNTALLDNPSLTVRSWHGRQPVRVVIDRKLKLPHTLNIFSDGLPLVVINEIKSSEEGDIKYIKTDFEVNFTDNLMKELYNIGLQSVVIEGGRVTLESFIKDGLWDEAFVYQGNTFINHGIEAPLLNARPQSEIMLGGVRLFIFRK